MAKLTRGDTAPDFEAYDAEGKSWSLRDLKGRRVVLYFYPADDTPGCTLEACDFRDRLGDFQQAGYTILGVSAQGADTHRAFREKFDLNFPLLVDEDLRLAEAYGVRSERRLYGDIPLEVRRSTFVIDEDGMIEQAMYGVNPQGHVDELKASLGI